MAKRKKDKGNNTKTRSELSEGIDEITLRLSPIIVADIVHQVKCRARYLEEAMSVKLMNGEYYEVADLSGQLQGCCRVVAVIEGILRHQEANDDSSL